jgi:predicted naringenin-chalcone synthase
MKMAFLHNLKVLTLKYKHTQNDILEFMLDREGANLRQKKLITSSFKHCGIQSRQSSLPDFSRQFHDRVLYKSIKTPTIEERMNIYKEFGKIQIDECVQGTLSKSDVQPTQITHLIIFSCTGQANPGFEIDIFDRFNLSDTVETHTIFFGGCHGAFKAIKLAKSIATSFEKEAHVLLIGLEMCTLHFNESTTVDQIRANTIFGDGCASFLISNVKPKTKSVKIGDHIQKKISNTSKKMSWEIGDNAFKMTLDGSIDKEISKINLKEIISKLAPDFKGNFICHPGGLSILNCVENQLQTTYNKELNSSRKVLSEYGNMSSTSILYVLNEELSKESKESIFAIGFGPGLTIECTLLEICN